MSTSRFLIESSKENWKIRDLEMPISSLSYDSDKNLAKL